MATLHNNIERALARYKPGDLIFPIDFRGEGSEGAIKMALSRLTKEEKIQRLAHGIYVKPKKDPLFGIIYPSAEVIAEAIAKKEKVRIKPAGAYALHKLGLTTQVPTKLVYLTDGAPRQIKVGNTFIKFKATKPKKLATIGKISSLVIQALEDINTIKIDATSKERIKALLLKEDPKKLRHDLKLAPAKVNDYIVKLLKESTDDRMAKLNG
ncbi:MAG TPA: DUF6088 family protein [Panacibacter sp.]|nr:DUF6088 family protein [Panacibacter sp.]